jgi:Arc/MetJ family transcription regulator
MAFPDQEAHMSTAVKKKTYNLDEEKIEQVRRLFHAKTDTEAIHRALQKTLEDHDIEQSLDQLLRNGRFRNVYR